MPLLAGTVVNNVRDLVPDQIYSAGVPQPDADGPLFRASTLYRWLDDGCRLMTSRTGWTLTDWYAFTANNGQLIYTLSELFQVVDQAFANLLQLDLKTMLEARAAYPHFALGPQAKTAYVFRQTVPIDIGFDPPPDYTDAQTTLTAPISATDTTIPVAAVAGSLQTGFALIDSELIGYQALSGLSALYCSRGVGGTTPASHVNGATVFQCSLWVRGSRVPRPITSSTSPLDVPLSWVSLLNDYLLGQCLISMQEHQTAAAILTRFDKACDAIAQQIGTKDPLTRRTGSDRSGATAVVPQAAPQVAG